MENASNQKRVPPCERISREVSVAFVQPLYEQNIGYMARAMKNFCLEKLYLVSPRCTLGLESRKYAMHAADIVENAVIVEKFEELVGKHDIVACSTGVKGEEPLRRHVSPAEMAAILAESTGSKLVVIGREDWGLSRQELSLCDLIVHIEANPAYPSLNASHAAIILFYEIYNKYHSYEPRIERPPRTEVEAFFRYLDRLAETLGYQETERERLALTIKRLINETRFTKRDLRALFGLVRDSLNAIEKSEKQEKNTPSK